MADDEPKPAAWQALLRRQAGAVSRGQLLSRGISDKGLRAHLAAARWQRPLPGVYLTFTGPPPEPARQWSALLYAGDGAVLSHETAGALWGIAETDPGDPVHVTVVRPRDVQRQNGIVVHRARRAVHAVESPPRTTAEATVFDLAATCHRVEQALSLISRAFQQGITNGGRLLLELGSRPTQRWRSELAAAVGDVATGAHSVLELRYLKVERAHGLPPGERQRRIAGTFQDVHYKKYRAAVELDGRLGHEGTADRWRDMARDNASAMRGEITLRYGWADVTGRPCAVARQVADVLKERGWQGELRGCGPDCAAVRQSGATGSQAARK